MANEEKPTKTQEAAPRQVSQAEIKKIALEIMEEHKEALDWLKDRWEVR